MNKHSLLRFTGKGFLLLIVLLLLVESGIYLLAPIYDFHEPRPFSGNKLFNPYEGLDSAHWHKANFHFHTRAWGGSTSGSQNSHAGFYRIYKMMGYDAPQISNYQSIDRTFADSIWFIQTYEHGFGIRKKHQILIGAREVLWLDYSLFQNRHHKQHILNLLRNDNEVVALAHPDWEEGYTPADVKYLTNYDLMEVLNHNWRSVPLWDSALSNGHPVFILSDDDAHDITDPYEIHRCCTFVHAADFHKDSLIQSLKEGKAYGVEPYMSYHETFGMKAGKARTLPTLNSVQVKGDTMFVSVSEQPLKINFIGQNGKLRKSVLLSKDAWYKFQPEDTYIRTYILFMIAFPNGKRGTGAKFYLNPVFRYDGQPPSNALKAEINRPFTWVFRIVGFGSVIALMSVILILRRKCCLKKNR